MKLSSQIWRYLQNPKSLSNLPYATRQKHQQTTKKLQEVSSTKSAECLEPCKVPKKSIWNLFGRKKHTPKCLEKSKPKPLPPEPEECISEEQAECDMQTIAAQMGGKAFRTCGSGYVLQKDYHEAPQGTETPMPNDEEHILEEMIKDPSLKGQCDPLPPFKSVELRLIELSERKLHPLYKKLMSIPKKPKLSKSVQQEAAMYKTRSGPVMPYEFPKHLKINREMFDKKNILYEYKRTEPPQQMLAMLIEMKMNERPQLRAAPKSEDRDCSE